MNRKVKRFNYNFSELYKYAVQVGKPMKELTEEERKAFVLGPLPFNYSCLHLTKRDKCFICGKETGWLDKKHGIYVCNEDCLTVADRRYEAGEDFIRHPICKSF